MKKLIQSLGTLTLFLAFALPLHAEAYKIDPAASKVLWKAEKKVGDGHDGHISIKEGQVDLDDKGEVKSGTVVVDMKTIANDDLAGKPDAQKKIVGHLSGEDFFNVEKYPTATFKLTSVTKRGTENIAKGELTFLDQTHPVEFPLTIKIENGVAKAQGKLSVDRTQWGLKYGSGNFFKALAADRIIKNEFQLDFEITAKKALPS